MGIFHPAYFEVHPVLCVPERLSFMLLPTQWVGKGSDPTDTMTFHFLRAYHCAGRCTDCGACERVCPVGISMRQFTKKLNKDAEAYFGWEAGLRLEERPPLDVYRPDDYNDFVR